MSERAIQNGYLIVAQQEIDELRRQKAVLVGTLEKLVAHLTGLGVTHPHLGAPSLLAEGVNVLAAAKGKP